MYNSIRWAFNVKDWKPSRKEWDLAVQCIQKEEKERIYRYVYREDVKASMVGQLLMRKASSQCTGIPYNTIVFARTDFGKPYITNHVNATEKKFNFNISHNGDYCVIAGEHDYAVGVDVMKIEYRGHTSVQDYIHLMRKQFSHGEMEFILYPGSTEQDQLSRFYRLWCLKESYVKAKGIGITCDLSKLQFCCSTTILPTSESSAHDTELLLEGNPVQDWRFEEAVLDKSHCVAVAIELQHCERYEGENSARKFTILNYSDLISDCLPFEKLDQDDWTKFSLKLEKEHRM